jgi:hypothetical protein
MTALIGKIVCACMSENGLCARASAKLVRRRRFVAMRERQSKAVRGLCESRSSRSADPLEQRTHRLLPHDSITSPPPPLLQCKCDFRIFLLGSEIKLFGTEIYSERGESGVLLIG